MGGACGTYGGAEKCVGSFGKLKGGDNLEDLSIVGERFKPLTLELDIYSLAHHLCKM